MDSNSVYLTVVTGNRERPHVLAVPNLWSAPASKLSPWVAVAYAENTNGGVDTIPPLPPLSPSLILSFTLQSNQLESLGSAVSSPSGVRGEAPAENEFGALYRDVRKPLLAIILSILKCMFYSRSIIEPANGGGGLNPQNPSFGTPLLSWKDLMLHPGPRHPWRQLLDPLCSLTIPAPVTENPWSKWNTVNRAR